MNKSEVRQLKKNEALNKIRKLYNERYTLNYDQYTDESYAERIEFEVKGIIEKLEKDLKDN